MNKGNNVLVCIGLLILIYFLFSGVVIEGITTYMKGSAGALCDSGRHIASKKECGEALKSLDLPTKEWWTGNDKEMPPYCSISIGKDPEQAQWNESVTGKGHEGSFAICKGDEGPKTPEQADADLTQKARDYLRGIGDELKDLGKLRNKKRRTPVNIHIDVGDGPGQSSLPVTTDGSRPSLGSADFPTQGGGQGGGQDGGQGGGQGEGQKAERCKFKLPCDVKEMEEFYKNDGKEWVARLRKGEGREPTKEQLEFIEFVGQNKMILDMCACVEKSGEQDAICIPQDDPEGDMVLAEFYKNHFSSKK